MARRKKNQDPIGGIAGLIIAIPLMIWNAIKAHPIATIITATILVGLIAYVVADRKKKRAEYLRWFYDRKRRLDELNAYEYLDADITGKIDSARKSGNSVKIGTNSSHFKDFQESFNTLVSSQEIVFFGEKLNISDSGRAIIPAQGISPQCNPVILKYIGENNGGYAFYMFPETILAFVEGPEKSVFLAAYNPSVLKLDCEDASKSFSVVVHEKSQNSIRYYDRYIPIKDAAIISSYWKVQNKDGSRSFRGGLLPENNPLIFSLLYGKMILNFGVYSVATAFSNHHSVEDFVDAAQAYSLNAKRNIRAREYSFDDEPDVFDATYREVNAEESSPTPTPTDSVFERTGRSERRDGDSIKEKPENNSNDVFTKTSASVNDIKDEIEDGPRLRTRTPDPLPKEPAPPQDTPKKNTVTEPKDPPHAPLPQQESEKNDTESVTNGLTVDSVRVRNREICKNIAKALNIKLQGKYDFKVYQVKKVRDDWGLQDAGVYATVNDSQGNEYTIEYDLRTNIDNPKTILKFSIWGKTKELVLQRYPNTVQKVKMQPNGAGFTTKLDRGYEKDNVSEMQKMLLTDIWTLFSRFVIPDENNDP